MANDLQCGACYARLEDSLLVVGNDCVERRWRLDGAGGLRAVSLVDRGSGREWFSKTSERASLSWGETDGGAAGEVTLTVREAAGGIVADVIVGEPATRMYRMLVLPGVAGVTVRLRVKGDAEESRGQAVRQAQAEQSPGIEGAIPGADVVEAFEIDPLHVDLRVVRLVDQTDHHDNLAFESRWMLQPAERVIEASGDVISLERRLSGEGLIFVRHAPLPHARPVKCEYDVRVEADGSVTFPGHGLPASADDDVADADGWRDGYAATLLCYQGGREGRIAAMQTLQLRMRPSVAGRDGLFLSNTWGDRSQDAGCVKRF